MTIDIHADAPLDICGAQFTYTHEHAVTVCAHEGETVVFVFATDTKKGKWVSLGRKDALDIAFKILLSALFGYEP